MPRVSPLAMVAFCLVLLAPDPGKAEPYVENVTGELVRYGTLFIHGSGFGTKDPAAPILYDSVTNQVAYAHLNEGDLIPTQSDANPAGPWEFSSTEGDGVRFTRQVSRFIGGAGYTVNTSGFLRLADLGDEAPDRLFVNWWFATSVDLPPEVMHRFIRVREDFSLDGATVTWSQNHLAWSVDDDHDGIPESTSDWADWGEDIYGWKNLELRIDSSLGIDLGFGRVEALVDGTMIHEASCWASEPLNYIWILGMDVSDPSRTTGEFFAWTDIYIDNSFARVFISDSPTAEPGSHCELQIPKTWSDDLITVAAMPGSFPPGAQLYLFVVVDDADQSTASYPVVVEDDEKLDPPETPSLIEQ